LCIDDDAFFINNNWDCTSIFQDYPEDLIVTKGRGKKTGVTLFNAGVMFIRNTPIMKEIFSKTPYIKQNTLNDNWRSEWGPLVGNEQPRLIYLTQTLAPKNVKIIDYPGFNAHDVTFKKSNFIKTNPPIVHITGQNKEGKIERFTQVTGIPLP
jgi:hypothetical protein